MAQALQRVCLTGAHEYYMPRLTWRNDATPVTHAKKMCNNRPAQPPMCHRSSQKQGPRPVLFTRLLTALLNDSYIYKAAL